MEQKLRGKAQYLYLPKFSDELMRTPDLKSILPLEKIIAQLVYMSSLIGIPTTIIQFNREGNDALERIDSPVSGIMQRDSCDLLRRCSKDGASLCKQCDESHAMLFHG